MNNDKCYKLLKVFYKKISEIESYKNDILLNSDDFNSHSFFLNKYQKKEKEYLDFYDKNKIDLEYCSQK